MDKKKKANMGKIKITKKQLDMLAEYIHTSIAYTALSVFYAIDKIYAESTPPEVREKEEHIIEGIISTSNTLYSDLTDEQRKLLRNEAKDFLKAAGLY